MPFSRVGTNKYVSPSGKKFTGKQVRMYYANGGRFPGEGMRESFPKDNTSLTRRPARRSKEY
jgi:hypothetical protein